MDHASSSSRARRSAMGVALLLSIAVVTAACRGDDRGSPTDATLTDTAYENTYFGFSLPLPAGWSVATPETQEHLRELGRKAVAGDDPQLQASVDAATAKTFQLLTISEHPVGAPVAFNPAIIVMAENISPAPGVKTGADYLFHLAGVLKQSAVPYEPRGEVSAVDLGGHPFHRRDFEISPPSGVRQSYLFAREGDYALGFIVTARDSAELEKLVGLVSQVRFH